MKIEKVPGGLKIDVESVEIIDYFLKLALKQIKNKKPYRYSTAYASSFKINIRYIETPSKRTLNKRKAVLEKAKKIKLTEFIEEFRLTSTEDNKRLISQFCNVFKNWGKESLEGIISEGKKDALRIRGVGPVALDLFEQFLKKKGFEFASWTGEKWI